MKQRSSKPNPHLQLPLTVDITKGLTTETHIARYLYEMFKFVGVKGPITVQVVKKVRGSGFRHGVELKGIKYNAVRCFVQSSDNGTCFLVYVRSAEMTPMTLLRLIESKVSQGRFTTDMARMTIRRAADLGLVDVGEALTLAGVSTATTSPKISLAGGADDVEIVAMIIISIRLKHGMDGFSAKSFHELIQKEYAPDASNKATGQLIRRIVANGYMTSEGKVGKKIYRLAESGIRLLTEHDKSVAESAVKALNITAVDELFPGLQKLEIQARQHAAAAQEIVRLKGEIEKADKQIEEKRQEVEQAIAAREKLRAQAREQQDILDTPELAAARKTYDEFQMTLKGK